MIGLWSFKPRRNGKVEILLGEFEKNINREIKFKFIIILLLYISIRIYTYFSN